MSYQSSILEKVEKYKAFFADDRPGQILASISPYTFELDYSQFGIKEKAYSDWNIPEDIEALIDHKVKLHRCFLEYTKDLDNDYIPGINPALGAGLSSAFFSDADIILGKDTSWVHPVLQDYGDLDKLSISDDNRWVQVLVRMQKRIMELNDGDYAPSAYGFYGPSDLANAIRGNDLFYDYYDYPDELNQLMDKCADATIWLRRRLRSITGDIAGGSITADMWFPGDVLYLSEDASDLCSAELYRQFNSKHTQKIIDHIGGAYIHHHAKGAHIHSEVSKLKNLKALELSWDPNCPRPIDNLRQTYEWNNGIPLQTRCTAQDVYAHIDELMEGRIILMLNVTSLEEGKEVMKFIRKHSKI